MATPAIPAVPNSGARFTPRAARNCIPTMAKMMVSAVARMTPARIRT